MQRVFPLSSMILALPFLFQVQVGSSDGNRTGAPIEAEARQFMNAYAADLRSGRRKSIVARYDANGAYRVGEGQKTFETFNMIREAYETEWSPPASFEWRDLSFEAVGNDAVVVVGLFDWGLDERTRMTFSYTGLLVRKDGELKIRLEDESRLPRRAGS